MSSAHDHYWPTEVLLVENNAADVFVIQRVILKDKLNIHLNVVEDGKEALNFLLKHHDYAHSPTPHLILLELNLPRMDGRDLLKEMQKYDGIREIPVIVLASSDNEDDVLDMYEAHCSGYFVKPTDIKQFHQLIAKVLDYWQAATFLPPRYRREERRASSQMANRPRRAWLNKHYPEQ